MACEKGEQNEELNKMKTFVSELQVKNLELEKKLEESEYSVQVFAKEFFDISQNLEKIAGKKQRILEYKENGLYSQEELDKLIKDDLETIAALMKKNNSKLQALSGQLQESENQNEKFKLLIEELNKTVKEKDEEILFLTENLNASQTEFVKIFEEYIEQSKQLEEAIAELRTAYFCFGSKKELKNADIIDQAGVFSSKKYLKNDFNKKYFQKVNIADWKQFKIGTFKSVELITNHDSSTYELVNDGGVWEIKISNPAEFWSSSKYLVILTK